jgi:hypothetical protein
LPVRRVVTYQQKKIRSDKMTPSHEKKIRERRDRPDSGHTSLMRTQSFDTPPMTAQSFHMYLLFYIKYFARGRASRCGKVWYYVVDSHSLSHTQLAPMRGLPWFPHQPICSLFCWCSFFFSCSVFHVLVPHKLCNTLFLNLASHRTHHFSFLVFHVLACYAILMPPLHRTRLACLLSFVCTQCISTCLLHHNHKISE